MTTIDKVQSSLNSLVQDYKTTPVKLKVIDMFLAYVLLTGIVQFAYCILVGTFPFNSFLSGFISTVATFVLAGSSPPLPLTTTSSKVSDSLLGSFPEDPGEQEELV